MRVALLAGGMSRERDISLKTGAAVKRAIATLGYECVEIDPGPGVAKDIVDSACDIAFIALHGKFGEDGTIQGLLEIQGIPYTGSGVLASSAAMDKVFTKKIFKSSGLPTPDFIAIHNHKAKGWVESVGLNIPFAGPYIVKPSREGSSLGITMVDNPSTLPTAIRTALTHDDDVLIEEFVTGKELTIGILGAQEPQALPPIEIVPRSGKYDYASKYTVGATEYIIPPRLEREVIEDCKGLALAAHRALGCFGVSRVDMIVGPNGIQLIEINTIPGMTETSLLPKSAAAAGIEFHQLVDDLLKWGLAQA